MKQFGKLVSMFVVHLCILKPAIYLNSWLRGRNPHKYVIELEITYTPKQ